MIKAFILPYDKHHYESFLFQNKLHRREYPMLTQHNWRGHFNVDLIQIGRPVYDDTLHGLVPYIRQHFLANREKQHAKTNNPSVE